MSAEIIQFGACSRRQAAPVIPMPALVPSEDAIHCVLSRRTYEVKFYRDCLRAYTVTQCRRSGKFVVYRRESDLDPLDLLAEAEAFVFPTNREKLRAELGKIRAELVAKLDGVSRAIAAHEAIPSGSGDAQH
jgi:hypothetical protein